MPVGGGGVGHNFKHFCRFFKTERIVLCNTSVVVFNPTYPDKKCFVFATDGKKSNSAQIPRFDSHILRSRPKSQDFTLKSQGPKVRINIPRSWDKSQGLVTLVRTGPICSTAGRQDGAQSGGQTGAGPHHRGLAGGVAPVADGPPHPAPEQAGARSTAVDVHHLRASYWSA